MDTRFDFKTEEPKIYAEWEKNGHFQPIKDAEKAFSIVLPPPNANADLHLGHAMYVIEDIMVRYHRMKGDATLWLPGADHAGFETQFVYEKHLAKEGKSRFDFDRETLFKNILDFVEGNRGKMENQLRRLGFSLDFTRKKFTLDEDIQKIVYKTFKKMFDDGLIYRGERLVNYCTKDGTSFSDLEVIHEEIDGKLYFIKYPLSNSNPSTTNYPLPTTDFIVVATTRPETMFGDVAIAVNLEDPRYKNLIGQYAKIPFTEKEIPIIADIHAKQEFGTGAVKITPCHDTNDFEVGKRHNLKGIQIINFFGKLNENVPTAFQKLNILMGREKIVEELQKLNLVEKIENHKMVIGKCYKCGRILESLPLPQWFVKIKPLIEPAIIALEKEEIKVYPQSKKDFAIEWLNKFYDWNISRQTVWGMRIPAWKCNDCSNNPQQYNNKTIEQWIITDGKIPTECPQCHGKNLTQDPDSFDTWFSSSQWPFATLQTTNIRKNPLEIRVDPNLNQTDDFTRFYPTTVMETGYDILPIWVCRMIFMGIYATGKIPFKNVYLHGLVRDSKGQKMSKSKGNVVNPLEMVDKYGADALRASLLFGIGQGADVPFSENKVRAMRNFVTKIWNIGRFISEGINKTNPNLPFYEASKNGENPNDKEILAKLERLIQNTSESLENYDFSRGLGLIYDFLWHELADIYIENIKSRIENKETIPLTIARHVFLNCLKLLHPFMPFVTEALWNQMPRKNDEMLIISHWPKTSK
jgi:valyl-tRNA synthetase